MLFERCHIVKIGRDLSSIYIFIMYIKYFNFRSKVQLDQGRSGAGLDWPPTLHLVNFLSGIRARLRFTATMGRSVLKDERMKERIHAVFTTGYFNRTPPHPPHRAHPSHPSHRRDERMKDPVFTTNISIGVEESRSLISFDLCHRRRR